MKQAYGKWAILAVFFSMQMILCQMHWLLRVCSCCVCSVESLACWGLGALIVALVLIHLIRQMLRWIMDRVFESPELSLKVTNDGILVALFSRIPR